MLQGIGKGGASQSDLAVNSPLNSGGASASGGLLANDKDAKQAATSAKYGEIYNEIQAKYGERPEKPREIKKTLGKDDFLKIMITQMKNQDPINPFKAEQMATEIAQFTSVEQLQNVNQNLNKMAAQNKPIEQMAMTNLIGKNVTIDRGRFPHLEGQTDSLEFRLPKNAATVHVQIANEAGESVFEKDLGSEKAGNVNFNWDGIRSNSLPAKAGNYMIRIEAKDDRGQAIETNPQMLSKIVGISFEGTEPIFLVGDSRHQDKVTMRNIVRIEMDSIPSNIGKNSESAVSEPPKQNNFIGFQRGVGSNNLDGFKPEELKVVNKGQNDMPVNNMPKIPVNNPPEIEKGFPNGLQDPDQAKIEIPKGGDIN